MDKITPRGVVKTVVAFSVGHVIKNLIQNNLEPENRLQRAEVAIGSFVLGGIVADQAVAYVDNFIDALNGKTTPEDTPPVQ